MSFEDVVVHHEAGHVLACLIYGIQIDFVKLDHGLLGGLYGGHVELSTEKGLDPKHNAVMTLAGASAEAEWNARHGIGRHFDHAASSSDLELAHEVMRHHKLREKAIWAEADRLVARAWPRIEGLAEILRERRRLARAAARRAARV